jgi:hypothetical protein
MVTRGIVRKNRVNLHEASTNRKTDFYFIVIMARDEAFV